MINGILIIDKPQDYTSFDVIAILRKKFNQKKIGHMGTLDPMATGVLPILLGSAAKFQIYAPENIKEYIYARFSLEQKPILGISGAKLSIKQIQILKLIIWKIF